MTAHDITSLQLHLEANPTDFAARLIYADALEDQGEPEWATWQRALAEVARGSKLANPLQHAGGVIRSWSDLSLDQLIETARASGVPGLDGLVRRCDDEREGNGDRAFAGKVLWGRLWLVAPGEDADLIAEEAIEEETEDHGPVVVVPERYYGWHGDDMPPCSGEWVGDADESGPEAYVLCDGRPEVPIGWEVLEVEAPDCEMPWLLHTDSVGRTFVLAFVDGEACVHLDY